MARGPYEPTGLPKKVLFNEGKGKITAATKRKWENQLIVTSAISATFHQDRRRYQSYYDKHGPELGGFPGIWGLCVEAGKAFDEVTRDVYDYDHIDALDHFVDAIYKRNGVPNARALKKMAQNAYKAHQTQPREKKRGRKNDRSGKAPASRALP